MDGLERLAAGTIPEPQPDFLEWAMAQWQKGRQP